MNELVAIASLIENNYKFEERDHVENHSIAGGYVLVKYNNTYRRLWITNQYSGHDYTIIRNITGQACGTCLKPGSQHQRHPAGEVFVCKHMPVARAVIDGFGHGIKAGNLTYDILQSYFWGTSIHGKIKVGTIDLGKWVLLTLAEMLATQSDAITDEERAQLELKLKELESKQENIRMIVRQSMALRNNPILDRTQENILLSHVFDGTALVIDGGPGTGKTTTLIQRLKYLISPQLINQRREELDERPLTKHQIELLDDDRQSWIFFSPTSLLRNYLQSNMEYEGLRHLSANTAVWSEYLHKILRDDYTLFGDEYPFDYKKRLRETKIFKKTSLSVIKSFTGFFLKKLVQRIAKVTSCRYDFEWKQAGLLIISECQKIKESHSLLDIIKGLIKLENLKEVKFIAGVPTIPQVIEKHSSISSIVCANHFIRLKKDDDLFAKVCELVNSWFAKGDEETDDEEDMEQYLSIQDSVDIEVKVSRAIRSLLRKLALNKIDPKITVNGRMAELKSLVDPILSDQEINELAPYAWFNTNFYPLVRNIETILFSSIPTFYKEFRRSQLKQKKDGDWYLTSLRQIVEEKSRKGKTNRALHPQEQALLLGFINNLILTVRKISSSRYDRLNHKYVTAFKQLCRPIIGVDEATDYTAFDYYAISSLRHPDLSCVTLTGDIMQGLVENGISNWSQLNKAMLFPKLDVKELTISYRQSPKLMTLASYIYKTATGKVPLYKSTEQDSDAIPYPLWYRNGSEEEKAMWIIQRILEIRRFYNKSMPSVAVFVDNKDSVRRLVTLLKDEDGEAELESYGIDVVDCSNEENNSSSDKIRVFPIEMVKGLEFQVVFFHNIENIPNSKLLDRYLYVGLSRATYHMAVTSGMHLDDKTESIASLFRNEGHW